MTVLDIATMTNGRFFGRAAELALSVSSVSIDSRSLKPGALFTALPGENTDGHQYIDNAFAAGAVCALVERVPADYDGTKPLVIVPDTAAALKTLAQSYRQRFDIPLVGVTGSVGKTTTKDLIYAVLSERFQTHRTEGNFNNELGVPLTLFGLQPQHEAAVVEMGISDFGEMSRLTQMARPTAAVFTAIGDAHLEFLHDRDGVMRAKAEIVGSMPPDGKIFLNGDDSIQRGFNFEHPKVYYGTGADCDVRAERIENLGLEGTRFEIHAEGCVIPARVQAFGTHMVYPALAAAAVGLSLGVDAAEIARGIERYQPESARSRTRCCEGNVTVIDDCYNANPTSMAAALESLAALSGRRVAILGDMRELGDNADSMHRDIGALCVKLGIERLITVGELAEQIHIGAGSRAGDRYFTDKGELSGALPELLSEGDVILVKASHGLHLEKVVDDILALYTELPSRRGAPN